MDLKHDSDKQEHDVFKDTPVRFLGYANELGESFRPVVPRSWVTASYVLAGSYVLADTTHKSWESMSDKQKHSSDRMKMAIERGLDTALWQGLASIAIPGIVINRIVWAASKVKVPVRYRSIFPTAMGLASIPFIVTPIDCMVHHVADCTYRPHIKKVAAFGTSLLHPPGQERGFSTGSGAEGADA
ncbi:hypothetical protein GUITHDRAFT_85038 [Guillardia theta CCMP2712]|uniref:Mitochondrial fission process protein 1 n=2 Tax=Guillardia theta TaxID=55529 RepID=L1JTV5_GUITC|nr:hypothetical protein GUITHDRAFT_85038 [Guillardia theta CCMP2712]EKX51635.1 hypothetical protein GUITHDRAFT_85038 [Guillardia theta CCMP2712]|mmetsp:Transcript_33852/g.106178  ORF Transcript_33852/g.106178 Transcript_33852/m.106178 type:complete len:186 (+) Transcript_33852:257-814(+)|eukprot:XP_005838615.1 hypothetical protein GUITHDRAFT_85038 [Guillardia theta CCMP2712]